MPSRLALYRRDVMLPRLIPVGPHELADQTAEGQAYIVRRLWRSLRGERTRGRAGHWSYDLNRHVGLVQALKQERELLRRLTGQARQPNSQQTREGIRH